MAKTHFLQIRLAPQDRERINRLAAAQHLDASTWARQVLLRALDGVEPSEAGASAHTPHNERERADE
jgi:hypothetical protein